MSRQIYAVCLKCLFSLVLLVSIGLPALGQSASSAAVNGIVQDTTDARIPNASVKLINTDTGTESNSKTSKDGNFSIPSVLPGHYRLQIEREGFDTTQLTGITLNVGDNKEVIIRMKVGSPQQTINVDSSETTINTVDASVSTVIDRKFVDNIPLNGRSFQSLILLTPGVVTSTPQIGGTSGSTGEFSVNGQRTDSNVYTVDGVNANTGGFVYGYGTSGTSGSLPAATALGTTQSLVSVDALQEFRVLSSSYSAEYGLSPGGQFSFATRSGTNQPHGGVFDYLRNNYFDANDWFNDNLGQPITALRQNDFGGTFGAPIWIPKIYSGTNKTFFFVSYEGLRLVQPQPTVIQYVPSISLRQSSPAALQPVLNAFPVPTGPQRSDGTAPFIKAYSVPSGIDSTSVRFDEHVASKLSTFYRFADTQSSTESRSGSVLTSVRQSSYVNTLGITTAFSTRLFDDFRLDYTSNVGESTNSLDNFGGAQPANLLQLQGISSSSATALVDLIFPEGVENIQQATASQPQHAWNIVDSLTFTRGRHTLKVGADYRRTASSLQESTPYVYSLFDGDQAILANSAYFSGVSEHGPSYPAYTNIALYAQDEIRQSPRLGISLGVRWEVNPPPTQTSGSLPYIVQGDLNVPSGLTVAPAGTAFWKTSYYNFAPRLGLAYQAHNRRGAETVIRAGGGVFFDSGQQLSTQAFGNSPGQSATVDYSGASYPLTPAQLDVTIVNPPVAPYNSLGYYFPDRQQLPYTLQWNVSLEQAIGTNQAITFSYVGSNGRRLLAEQQYTNATNFTNVIAEVSGATSSYNALQTKFQRSLTRGLQVLGSYTWSHSIDFGSQNINFAQIRGNSDYDVRNSFNLAATYALPFRSSHSIVNNLVGHWETDARVASRTAFPVTLDGNELTNPNGTLSYSGLNLVPNVPLYITVPGIAGNRQINPAAFALPASGVNGDAPRNFARGFGENQVDMAAQRTFPLFEHATLHFRAEAFNILNHPNFGFINPYYGEPQFGQATMMLNQSLGNLSPLYQTGGPRSMQFALKVAF
jgi:hypothetical protein